MGIQINQMGYQPVDGILWGWCWPWNTPDNHARLTYSFPTSANDYQGYAEVRNFEAFNAAQRDAAAKALANFDAVSNLDFVYTADPAQANIRFGEATFIDFGSGPDPTLEIGTAFGSAPDNFLLPLHTQGDTWFNHTSYNDPDLGEYAYTSGVLHEIGHAVGLKHGHEPQPVFSTDGTTAYTNPTLPADHNSLEYSVMTYRAYVGAPAGNIIGAKEYPSTLMQDDILALQYLYGANYDHNSGNTTYKWSPTTGATYINGKSQGETYHGKIFMTVWDGGGNDTYDFSNYSTNATVNLTPGGWSTPSNAQRADLDAEHPGLHMARGCIANAMYWTGDLRPFIENAIGGKGSDKITGNLVNNKLSGLAGNDNLYGGDGIDTLTGGSGRDSLKGGSHRDLFDFNSVSESKVGSNRDVIQDFQRGTDDIDLNGIDAKSGVANNNTFKWIGRSSFHDAKGELRYIDKGASCIVQGDVSGDGKADFELYVKVGALSSGDFLL